MHSIQSIHHDSRTVALVAGPHAIVVDELPGRARQIVEAKFVYALEMTAGARPGPYRDKAATAYAERPLKRRARRPC